jgi:carboxylesterase
VLRSSALLAADRAGLVSCPRPASTYEEATARIAALQTEEAGGPALNPICCTQLLTHQRKVARAIVLLHGYTDCPQQFLSLGQQLHARGYNVLIPRLPHHGLADRMTTASAQLTAAELAHLTDEAVDAAHGLGEHVAVAGISAGGVMAAWAAQHRVDLDQAVVMSPALGLRVVPAFLTTPVMRLMAARPNRFLWWDPRTKEKAPGPGYPRFSTHGLSEILRLGAAVRHAAARRSPAAGAIVVITNASDLAVNNHLTAALVRSWRRHGVRDLRTYEFPLALRVFHDFISPEQVYQRVETVYPILFDLIVPPGVAVAPPPAGDRRNGSAE